MKDTDKAKYGVSIADIVSTAGVLTAAASLCIGQSFMTFDIPVSIISGVLFAIMLSVLVRLLVKCKKRYSSLQNRGMAEYAILTLIIITGIAVMFPTSYWLGIARNKENLQIEAEGDIISVRAEIERVKEDEKKALLITCTGLRNAMSGKAKRSSGLKDFMNRERIDSKSRIDEYRDYNLDLIDNMTVRSEGVSGIERYMPKWEEALDKAGKDIAAWNLIKLPSAIASINDVGKEAALITTRQVAELSFPVIERKRGTYLISADTQPIAPFKAYVKFRKSLHNIPMVSVGGAGLTLIIYIVVLMPYFVIPRSDRGVIKKNRKIVSGKML